MVWFEGNLYFVFEFGVYFFDLDDELCLFLFFNVSNFVVYKFMSDLDGVLWILIYGCLFFRDNLGDW